MCIKNNRSVPIVVILRTNRKNKLLNVLTEGLSSYGFTVINLNFKIKQYHNRDVLDKSVRDETKYVISTVLNYFKQNNLIQFSNFFLILYLKSSISYSSILSDLQNMGIVIINPILNSINLRNFSELIDKNNNNDVSKSQVCVVFSGKSDLNFNNKNLKEYLKEFQQILKDKVKLITLRKARKSYKYYETILLGLIVEEIEKYC